MSRIRSKNTGPERAMARLLRSNHIRFRRHMPLPGTPDFVLKACKVAVFTDGTFWHGRDYDKLRPKLAPFWQEKITKNIKRDRKVGRKLRQMGWKVVRVWEDKIDKSLPRILKAMMHLHV